MCLSSPPEEAYRHVFRHVPQLRLQDLTQNDITIFIHDRLEIPLFTSSSHHDCVVAQCQVLPRDDCPCSLMDTLRQRAPGVFLWVRLVVRDLLIGVGVGETVGQLQQRLEETPTELQDLYAHMLKKLPKSFLAHTTRYLSMMLAVNELEIHNVWASHISGLSLLDVTLSEYHLWDKVREFDGGFITELAFKDRCGRLESHVVYCCAGLVQVGDSTHETGVLKHARPLSFIHRSAIDFLSTSPTASSTLELTCEEAFLSLTRAKLGFWFLYFSGRLEEPFEDDELGVAYWRTAYLKAFPDGLTTDQVATDSTQHEKRSLAIMERGLRDAALLTEYKISRLGEHGYGLQKACEDVLIYHFALFRKYDKDLWCRTILGDSFTPRIVRGFSLPLNVEDDDGFSYGILVGSHRAIQLTQEHPSKEPSDFDSIINCVLSSPICRCEEFAVANRSQIACAAFDRGANF